MATMKDVAERAGVSASTVSHVINNTRLVSAELRERVLEAIQALEYSPDRLARSLRRGASQTLGLIIPDIVDPFFAEIARAVEDAGHVEGYSVILCNSDRSLEKELLYTQLLIDKRVDGVLFDAVGLSGKHVELLQRRQVPVVVVDREVSAVNTDSVVVDDFWGGYLAGEYLVKLGHRRIGFVKYAGLDLISPRVEGAMKAMRDAGIEPDETLVSEGDYANSPSFPGVHPLLSMDNPPTAIFAITDMLAIAALQNIAMMGLRVPEDISVIGFDNIRLAGLTIPPLTTVAQPIAGKSRLALQMLLERINQPDLPLRRQVLEVKIVERASTGPPAQQGK